MDLQTNANLDPHLLTGLPRLLYTSKVLVSKLFYEDIHRRAIIKFHFKPIYTANMFYSKLDAANAQWPEF